MLSLVDGIEGICILFSTYHVASLDWHGEMSCHNRRAHSFVATQGIGVALSHAAARESGGGAPVAPQNLDLFFLHSDFSQFAALFLERPSKRTLEPDHRKAYTPKPVLNRFQNLNTPKMERQNTVKHSEATVAATPPKKPKSCQYLVELPIGSGYGF